MPAMLGATRQVDVSPSRILIARLERSGDVSAIPTEKPRRVFTVDVAEGVQTVRIEIDAEDL